MNKNVLIRLLNALLLSLEDDYFVDDVEVDVDCYDTVFSVFENLILCKNCPMEIICANTKDKSCATLIVEYLQERKYKDGE